VGILLDIFNIHLPLLTGISTQGQAMFDNWVTKYAMSYSSNGKHWFMVTDRRKDNGSPRVSAAAKTKRISEKLNFEIITLLNLNPKMTAMNKSIATCILKCLLMAHPIYNLHPVL